MVHEWCAMPFDPGSMSFGRSVSSTKLMAKMYSECARHCSVAVHHISLNSGVAAAARSAKKITFFHFHFASVFDRVFFVRSY